MTTGPFSRLAPGPVRRLTNLTGLIWRNLAEHRLRTALSVLAVALGVAMILAASMAAEGIRGGVSASESGQRGAEWVIGFAETGLQGVGVIILVVAAFLIFNAFAMAITQRQEQIGVMRALGMTRRQVMHQVLAEALITGVCGTLLGFASGPFVGAGFLALVHSTGLEVGAGRLPATSAALAVVLGIGTTLLAVLIPANRATRISPLAALRQEVALLVGTEHGASLQWVGLAVIAGIVVYLVIAPPGEWTLPPWNTRIPLALSVVWLGAWLSILPTLIAGAGRLARPSLTRLLGATGCLMTDNLGREPRRVLLTVLSFAVSLAAIVGLTGILTFVNSLMFDYVAAGAASQVEWVVFPFDQSAGIGMIDELDLDTVGMKPEVTAEVYRIAQGRARVAEIYMVVVPEISALIPNLPSFIIDPAFVSRPGYYTFTEGDWETALPILESGCGLLIMPGVAVRHDAGIGDTITLQTPDGPLDCTVAGIGSGGVTPFSMISRAAKDAFNVRVPGTLGVMPLPGLSLGDLEALEADLMVLAEQYGADAWVTTPDKVLDVFQEAGDMMTASFNSMLLLAILAAALGVVNTTLVSVAERRRELGLLRAVGATRRQAMAVVAGETAMMGLIGGGLGLIIGAGISVIFAVSHGGGTHGVPDLPLWKAAWEATQPAIVIGVIGLVAAPLISALAATLPARSALRGSIVDNLEAKW